MSDIQFFALANKALEILSDIEAKLLDARKSHEDAVAADMKQAA